MLHEQIYKQAIQSMPVVCVDMMLTDVASERFLLVRRAAEPLKGCFWTPGGRVFTGESWIAAAERIVARELGALGKLKWQADPVGIYVDRFSVSSFGEHIYDTASFLMRGSFDMASSNVILGDRTSTNFVLSETLPARILENTNYFLSDEKND